MADGVKQRVVLNVVALCLIGVAAVLAGVAVMLWAVMPTASMQAPWALIAAPAVPAIVAVICVLVARHRPNDSFAELKQQVAADLLLLREAGAT
ncbi:MAG: hypothetical protein H7Y61_07285 [Rhizobiales bacterium]|nr:hypothetical protein [Rhizobacter sp.]